jgi:sugar phosphate permease
MAVFALSSAINYLDRQTFTTLAPALRAEFRLSHAEYGWILGALRRQRAVRGNVHRSRRLEPRH